MRYEAIPEITLKQLRDTDDAGRATKPYVDHEGGAPLRCCLRRSEVGESIALVSYAPLLRWAADEGVDPGAYLELGPVFIHAGGHGEECQGPDGEGELHNADRVFRAYNGRGQILGGTVVVPGKGKAAAEKWFANPEVALIHVRAIEFGCFMFQIRR